MLHHFSKVCNLLNIIILGWIAVYGKNFGTNKDDLNAFLQIKDTTLKRYPLKIETVKDDEVVVKL